MAYEECTVVGRNAVLEAYRSGKTIDKLFILDGCEDGPVKSIVLSLIHISEPTRP